MDKEKLAGYHCPIEAAMDMSEDYYRLLGLELPPCTNSKSKEGSNNV